ncbi:MAG: NPCBM/NEW2 domain-containing protein [Kiritimatiellales bacterium]|nr:NPCBM/NEW2 domain-containing protein [Kiritimatiellales bacterium]
MAFRLKVLMLVLPLLVSLSTIAAEREKLHIFYITTRDRDPQPEYRERIHRIMEDVQDFYRTEMKRNGYGPKTFQLDRDGSSKVVVNLIKLDWNFEPEGAFEVKKAQPLIDELLKEKGLDINKTHILVYSDGYWQDGDVWKYDIPYHGGGGANGGSAWVADHVLLDPENFDPGLKDIINDRGQKLTPGKFNAKMLGGVTHELGHAFGLPHNRETKEEKQKLGTALMGAGNYTYRMERIGKRKGSFLTKQHAFILSLHPLFNGKEPENFDAPDVFIDSLSFKRKNGKLSVSGKAIPADGIAGFVIYNDELPTGVNKDYDAKAYLVEARPGGNFSTDLALPKDGEYNLKIKTYFNNGVKSTFGFDYILKDGQVDGDSLGKDYRWKRAKHAFGQKDAAALRKLMPQIEKDDPETAQQTKRFLQVAEQWEGFTTPAHVAHNKKTISLSSTRWDAAKTGWLIPSFDGVMDPEGKRIQPLWSAKGKCPQGLYAHPDSSYGYNLDGKWKKLKTRFGIQARYKKGSVVFVVKADGKEVFRSPLTRLADGEQQIELDVSRFKKLELITEPGEDGKEGDWGIWIDPTLKR